MGEVMGNVYIIVEKLFDFLDKKCTVDTPLSIDEEREETKEQKLQRRAEIQGALEDMRRQEQIMARRS